MRDVGSEGAASVWAFVSDVDVMNDILAAATDIFLLGSRNYYRAHDYAGGANRHAA
jgi:hypothetical protein